MGGGGGEVRLRLPLQFHPLKVGIVHRLVEALHSDVGEVQVAARTHI